MVTPAPPTERCDASECRKQTPLDMEGIIFGTGERRHWFCSPECSRTALENLETLPETISLHDPQYTVPRNHFKGIDEDAVSIQTSINGKQDALTVINEFESVHPSKFRHTPRTP